MKKRIALFFAGVLCSWASLVAEYDLDDRSMMEMGRERGQFQFNVLGDGLGKAKFTKKHRDHGHIQFDHFSAVADAVVWFNDCDKEGVNVGFGYEYTRLKVNPHFLFKRQHYDTALVNLTFFTHRLDDWRWVAFAQYNIDADKWDFTDYSTFDLLLWGRFDYCTTMGVHIGIYAETGMKADLVLPILGVDWRIGKSWKLNAVFPLNVSLIYNWNDKWAVALAARVFNERHRAGKEGLRNKAVWRYSNGGVELALRYEPNGKLQANIHAGYATGGKLKVASQHYHHKRHYRFDGSPYAGAEATVSF